MSLWGDLVVGFGKEEGGLRDLLQGAPVLVLVLALFLVRVMTVILELGQLLSNKDKELH